MVSPGGGVGGDAFLSHAAPRNSFKSDSRGEISINSTSAVQKRNYSAKQVKQMKIQCTDCWWIKLNVKIEEKGSTGSSRVAAEATRVAKQPWKQLKRDLEASETEEPKYFGSIVFEYSSKSFCSAQKWLAF